MNHVWQLMASFAPRLKSQIGQSVDCSSLSNPLWILRCSMLQSVSNHLQDEHKTGLACESRSTSSAIVERPFVQSQLTLQHEFDLNLCSEVTNFLPSFLCLIFKNRLYFDSRSLWNIFTTQLFFGSWPAQEDLFLYSVISQQAAVCNLFSLPYREQYFLSDHT